MANLTIQEHFELDAPPDRVWAHLVAPERIVVCLPGAELLGQEDERTFTGVIQVRVGAITVGYRGKVVFDQIDEENRYVRITGRGREKAGSGTASMTMESRVIALEGGRSEVRVDAEVRLAGKIVRFGRGMIETVSAEVFTDFTRCLAARLREGEAAPPPASDPSSPDKPRGAGSEASEPLAILSLLWRALKRRIAQIFGDA